MRIDLKKGDKEANLLLTTHHFLYFKRNKGKILHKPAINIEIGDIMLVCN